MMYKKTCHKKPKDMRMVDIPLKSKGESVQIERVPEEVDNADVLKNLRFLLNKISRDNFSRISDSVLNSFEYNEEIVKGLIVFLQKFLKIGNAI